MQIFKKEARNWVLARFFFVLFAVKNKELKNLSGAFPISVFPRVTISKFRNKPCANGVLMERLSSSQVICHNNQFLVDVGTMALSFMQLLAEFVKQLPGKLFS